jgi:methylglutaconyl-CoA hydratase
MGMIEIERGRTVAFVWLNRPEQHNALSAELLAALAGALEDLARDDTVRVVVLGGRGPSFCAGADIGAMKASASASFEHNLAEAQALGAAFAGLADFPKPVVGRVHGSVLGGGVGLVCACDIVVAGEDARFGLTEVRLGIIPGLISPYVLRRLGDRHARELMLTGERFGADVALRVGLVHYAVTAAELDARVNERVGELLKGGPQAQRRIKALLRSWADSTWEDYRGTLPRALAEARASDEARDGLAAFFEKRKPGWITER